MVELGKESGEWRDGQLFVGNQLALDFLNTDLIANGEPVELLPDPAAVARWTAHAELIPPSVSRKLERTWQQNTRAPQALHKLHRYRDQLRTAVFAFESGSSVAPEFLQQLNELLQRRPMLKRVEPSDAGGYVQSMPFDPQWPDDLLAPLAEATMMLLTTVPHHRVRKCEGCPVHFQDVSKKGSRRWCSMNLCGNKIKVAAYQRRQHSA